jgi:ABC-2 type transport system ATP-binding protein
MFGASLHVNGLEADAMMRTVRRLAGEQRRVETEETGLEDVFIYMMQRSQDNFGRAAP